MSPIEGKVVPGAVVYVAPSGTGLPTSAPDPADGWRLLGHIDGVEYTESEEHVGGNAWATDTVEFTVRAADPWTLLHHRKDPVLLIYPPGRSPCDRQLPA